MALTTRKDRAFLVLAGAIGAGIMLASMGGWYAGEGEVPKALPAGMLVIGIATAMIAAANEVLGHERHRMEYTRLQSLRGFLMIEYRKARADYEAQVDGWIYSGERARTLHQALTEAYTTFGERVPDGIQAPPERVG